MSTDKHPMLYAVMQNDALVTVTENQTDAHIEKRNATKGASYSAEVVEYVPASELDALRAEVEALRRERDAARDEANHRTREVELTAGVQARLTARAEKAERERDRVADFNEAMREPMRKIREAVGDFGSGETVVVEKLIAAKDAAVAHAAALEAALTSLASREHTDECLSGHIEGPDGWDGKRHEDECDCGVKDARDAISGGTSALDAHDAATVDAIVKRVEGLHTWSVNTSPNLPGHRMDRDGNGNWLDRDDVLAALAKGGK